MTTGYTAPVSQTERASLITLGAAAFLVSADARVIDPLLKIIAGELGVSTERAALTVSAYAIPYGLCQLFYGSLGDRVVPLRVMASVMALFSLGTLACAAVPNLWTFIALRLLTGAVAAGIIPLAISYIGEKFPYESRQSALGRFMSALMLGQILSATLGGIFGEHLNWRDIFVVFGVVGLAVAALMFRESKRFPEAQRDRRFSPAAMRGSQALRTASVPPAAIAWPAQSVATYGPGAAWRPSSVCRMPRPCKPSPRPSYCSAMPKPSHPSDAACAHRSRSSAVLPSMKACSAVLPHCSVNTVSLRLGRQEEILHRNFALLKIRRPPVFSSTGLWSPGLI